MLIMCSIHLRYIIAWYAHLSFSMKKANMMLKQIGEVNEIHLSNNKYTQKNTLCTNKIYVIYFCPSCVNCLPKNAHFFIFFFWGGYCPPPLPPSACAPMCTSLLKRKFSTGTLQKVHSRNSNTTAKHVKLSICKFC